MCILVFPQFHAIKPFFIFCRKDTFLCKSVCDAVVPFIIAAFIIGTLVSIGYIILGVNGMRNEIELLKIQLFKGIEMNIHEELALAFPSCVPAN